MYPQPIARKAAPFSPAMTHGDPRTGAKSQLQAIWLQSPGSSHGLPMMIPQNLATDLMPGQSPDIKPAGAFPSSRRTS